MAYCVEAKVNGKGYGVRIHSEWPTAEQIAAAKQQIRDDVEKDYN